CRRQSKIFDDLHVLPRRELAEQVRRTDHQDGEQDKVVEDLVADRFAKDVDGNRGNRSHGPACALSSSRPRRGDIAAGEVTRSTNRSSSVGRIGLSEITRAPPAASSTSSCSGGGSSGRSSAYRPSLIGTTRRMRPSA